MSRTTSLLRVTLLSALALALSNEPSLANSRTCEVLFTRSSRDLVTELVRLKTEVDARLAAGDRPMARLLNQSFTESYRQALRLGVNLSNFEVSLNKARERSSADSARNDQRREVTRESESRRLKPWLPERTVTVNTRQGTAVLTRDGQHLISVSKDSGASILNLETGAVAGGFPISIVHETSLLLSADEKHLAVMGSTDKSVALQVYSYPDGRLIQEFQTREGSFSPDGKSIAVSEEGRIAVYEIGNVTPKYTLFTGWANIAVRALTFTPDGKKLFVGRLGISTTLWDLATSRLEISYEYQRPYNLALSPDGSRLAISSIIEESVTIHQAGSAAPEFTLASSEDGINAVAFSPDGKNLLGISDDKNIYIWNIAGGEVLAKLPTKGEPRDLMISADGSRLIVTEDAPNSQTTIRIFKANRAGLP